MTQFYAMRARNSGNSAYLSWVVTDVPDTLGSFAPAAIFAGSAQVVDQWEDSVSQAADTFVGRLAGSGIAGPQLLSNIDSTSLVYDATSHTFQVAAASGGDITKSQNSNTFTINNDAVTYGKIQNVVNNNRFLGRISGANGDIEELTGTQATTLLDNFTSTLKGLAPLSGGGTTNFLRADGTWAAPPGTITAGHVIRVNNTGQTQRAAANFLNTTTITAVGADDAANGETELSFTLNGFTGGDVTSSANSLNLTIANNAVTNAKAADMAANTVKVNNTAGSTDPTDMSVGTNTFVGRLASNIQTLTGTQATTLLDNFTSALKGLAPASGGGTANFLRADGTWTAPPGTLTAGHVIRVNNTGQTQRAAANFLNTTTITAAGADDAANGETELSFTLNGFTGGDVTSSANSLTLTIANNAVTNAKAADMAANTVKVNNTAGSTDPTDMSVGTNTFVGRLASNIQTLTGTQATTLLDNFTSSLKGLAPASGGGTTNFLRADGNWTAPTALELDITETENTSTGAIDAVAKATGESVYMFSGTAPVLQGIVSTNTGVGNPMFIHRQGTGNLEIQDDASATATSRFAMYRDSDLLLGDDEIAGFVKVDLTSGGTNNPRWACFTHRAPFANTTDNALGDTIIHDGLDWKSRPADIRSSVTTVTNSTSPNTCTTLTVPANSLVVGSTFEVYAAYSWIRSGASPTTATNIGVALNVDGVAAISVSRATVTTGTIGGNIFVAGTLTVRSIGAGGTISFAGTIDDQITSTFQNTNQINVLNIDTTASFVINVTATFTVAVSNCSTFAQVGYIRRLA